MAVQTLVRRRNDNRTVALAPALRRPVRVTLRPKPAAAVEQAPKASKLEEVEDRLIAEAIERHANTDGAIDAALDDMAALVAAELHDSRRRPLLLRSTTSLNRVEDLLLEAVLRTHPNREHAFDRLLEDLGESHDEDAARAAFDMSIDNDFDGLA